MTTQPKIKNLDPNGNGYLWLNCDYYNLPDNTAGGIGYHVFYRPLCGSQYQGNELLTDAMLADIKEFYATEKAENEAAEKLAMEKRIAALSQPAPEKTLHEKMLCPHCHTVCYGDCR